MGKYAGKQFRDLEADKDTFEWGFKTGKRPDIFLAQRIGPDHFMLFTSGMPVITNKWTMEILHMHIGMALAMAEAEDEKEAEEALKKEFGMID